MWIGIFVLATFGAAALACLYLSFRGLVERQWHVAVALLLPGVVIGGTLVMMVGPTIWIAVAGNSAMMDLPEGTPTVSAADLPSLFEGKVHVGDYYESAAGGSWRVFEESYDADGGLSGTGGPADRPDAFRWGGTWIIEGDRACYDYGEGPDCVLIYVLDGRYVEVNERDEIRSNYTVIDQVIEEETDSGS